MSYCDYCRLEEFRIHSLQQAYEQPSRAPGHARGARARRRMSGALSSVCKSLTKLTHSSASQSFTSRKTSASSMGDVSQFRHFDLNENEVPLPMLHQFYCLDVKRSCCPVESTLYSCTALELSHKQAVMSQICLHCHEQLVASYISALCILLVAVHEPAAMLCMADTCE